MIAAALKVYREKYRPIRMTLILGKSLDLNLKGMTDGERDEWRQIESILTHPFDYIEIVPQADHGTELPRYYREVNCAFWEHCSKARTGR